MRTQSGRHVLANKLYLAWQDQETRGWHTVGQLAAKPNGYEFLFTKGVKALRSVPSDLFRMEPGKRYRSEELMPLFRNRILPPSRADFAKVAAWVGLSGEENEFVQLEKFGRIAGTDALMVYPEPTVESGTYTIDFLVHGMRHLPEIASERCKLIQEGDELAPMLDVRNPVDPSAVCLREQQGNIVLGYIPAFYANDIYRILREQALAKTATVKVLRNNLDAPIQLRLLCRFSAQVDPKFRPLETEEHESFVANHA